MAIDWFTVIAQLVNFLVLVLLLKRFLYKPVLNAVAEREKKIAAQLADAAGKEAVAQQEVKEYADKNAALKREAGVLMDKALVEAQAERDRLIGSARQDAAKQRASWEAALASEQEHYGRELEQQVQDTVLGVTRKLLVDISGTTLEANAWPGFVRMLGGLDVGEKERLANAGDGSRPSSSAAGASSGAGGRVVIRSAGELSDVAQAAIGQALRAVCPTLPAPVYETDATLICGIGLYVDGYRLEWNIDQYLRQLREKLQNSKKNA